jgi:hypothetical protein
MTTDRHPMNCYPSRRGAFLPAVGLLLVLHGGCGPRLSESELGKVLRDIPKIEGADEPYPMPKLDEPVEETDKEKAESKTDAVDDIGPLPAAEQSPKNGETPPKSKE